MYTVIITDSVNPHITYIFAMKCKGTVDEECAKTEGSLFNDFVSLIIYFYFIFCVFLGYLAVLDISQPTCNVFIRVNNSDVKPKTDRQYKTLL